MARIIGFEGLSSRSNFGGSKLNSAGEGHCPVSRALITKINFCLMGWGEDRYFASVSTLAVVGDHVLRHGRPVRRLAAVTLAAVWLALQPASWTRTTRLVLARQIFYSGVQALWFTMGLGLFTGLGVVMQAEFWMSRLGQSELLGPFLVIVIIREFGPLLVNLMVIGRSGTAIAIELGGMTVRNEVKVLDAQGLDPMVYLIMPRVIGMAISVFCLTMFFAVISLASGYVCGLLFGVVSRYPELFLTSVAKGISAPDIANLLVKTLFPGLLVGVICCLEGLGVRYATEIPQASTRSVVRSNAALFVVCALMSILTYL